MSDTAMKIVTSFKCNLNCPYCCNNLPAVRNAFKPVTLKQISDSDYDSYQVTGGEPLLECSEEAMYEVLLAIPSKRPVYLYTNGILLSKNMAYGLSCLDVLGINIGYHQQKLKWDVLKVVNEIIPLTFWVQAKDKKRVPKVFKTRVWRMNNCATKAELFYLKG